MSSGQPRQADPALAGPWIAAPGEPCAWVPEGITQGQLVCVQPAACFLSLILPPDENAFVHIFPWKSAELSVVGPTLGDCRGG